MSDRRIANTMNETSFKRYFYKVFYNVVIREKYINELYEDVIKRYSSSNRHYHNINHIYSMTEWLKVFMARIENPNLVFIAIVYHDIIYKTTRSDNEEQSAQYFKKIALKKLDLKAPEIGYIMDLIRYTKHNFESPENLPNDAKYLLDFDLAVLSSSEEEYRAYCDNIRREFKIYPNFLYKKGRLDFLQNFLNKPKIYLTGEFLFSEKKVRENMENEIIYLNSPKKRNKV